MKVFASILAALCLAGASAAAIPDEDWGYIDPRPGMHPNAVPFANSALQDEYFRLSPVLVAVRDNQRPTT